MCVSECVWGRWKLQFNNGRPKSRAECSGRLVAWKVQFLFFCQFFWFCANDGFRGCSTLLFKEQNRERRRERKRERADLGEWEKRWVNRLYWGYLDNWLCWFWPSLGLWEKERGGSRERERERDGEESVILCVSMFVWGREREREAARHGLHINH